MEVKVLHMNGGEGDTSYAKNSSFQKRVIQTAKSAVEEAAVELCSAANFPATLNVADLGCSSGPNSLSAVTGIVDAVEDTYRQLGWRPPEFQLFLNDLPGNDFNSLFRSLQTFYEKREATSAGGEKELGRCFVAGVPGSFHGRLFPSRSIHFFHSSTSIHWLSQAPPELQQHGVSLNKRSIHITKESSPLVVNAYATQFEKDVSDFLRSRSEEMATGGRMVLTLLARRTSDPKREEVTFHWGLLTQVLMDMVQEGYITEEMVDSFNLPAYVPCATEMEGIIQREGSFSVKYLETVEVAIFDGAAAAAPKGGDHTPASQINGEAAAVSNAVIDLITNGARAALEAILASHFGGDVMEDLFLRYRKGIEANKSQIKTAKMPNLVISLVLREP